MSYQTKNWLKTLAASLAYAAPAYMTLRVMQGAEPHLAIVVQTIVFTACACGILASIFITRWANRVEKEREQRNDKTRSH